ncbi:polyamine-modulated factor 1 [Elgaria multicarinata webbii]|uniref:polyamine-modulated factor 1 n=1 Tax=Elgaria multicarinata webbii TaxID=159646 RepID=UPI002FCCC44E
MEHAEVNEEEAAASASTSTSSRPAPQGNLGREQILDYIVDIFLRTLEIGGYKHFVRCYKHLYKSQPELTKCIYNQFLSHLQSSVQGEIRELKEEGNLTVLFQSLDELIEGAKGRETPAWRPSGIPEEDARSVVVPYLLKQRKFLQKALKEKEKVNAKLAQTVLTGRKKIEDLQEEIRKRKEEWQAIAEEGRKVVSVLHELH